MLLKFISKYILYPLFQIKEKQFIILKKLYVNKKIYSLNKKEIDRIRLLKLRKLIKHSYNNCKYYRDLFDFLKIDINNFSFETLKCIPIITKDIINNNREDLVATNFKYKLLKDATGGSTASPLIFYRDKQCLFTRIASQLFLNKIIGWDIGTKYALIWGAGRDLSNDKSIKSFIRERLIFRRIHLDATRMNSLNIYKFINEFLKFKPEIIYGYPSAINELCLKLKHDNVSVDFVKKVICTAEPLNNDYRKTIATVFKCDVINRYTSRECGVLAQECQMNNGLHINYLSVDIQIRENRIILTDLDNYGMPLINYDIGDKTEDNVINIEPCKCLFPGPLITLGASRETDYFIKRDGTLIFGAGLSIIALTGETGIKNIQIIQKDYELFLVKIVKDINYTEQNTERIIRELKNYLGDDIIIKIIYVDRIDRIKSSGKYRYIISEIINRS